jgi:hypothetical protein
LKRLAANLPEGVSEAYFHPASRRDATLDRLMPTYHHEQELAALLDRGVEAAFRDAGAVRIGYDDLG